MQVKEITNEGLVREYEVTVDAEQVSEEFNKNLETVRRTAKLPGFRPGKVPVSLVKKRQGAEILQKALESTVNQAATDLLKEKNVRPALQPKIEIKSYDEGKQLVFTASLEIFPNIPEINWADIKLEVLKVKVAEKEINDGLENIKSNNKDYAPLIEKRAAESDDAAIIDFVGSVDGEEFEGGRAADFRVVIGSGQFIPGFEEQIIGKNIGDEFVIKATFPEEYHAPNLAGKEAEFQTTLKDILVAEEVELNDDFAKKIGFDTVEALRTALEEQIASDFNSVTKIKVKKELFDAIDDGYKFDIPQGMVDLEYNSLLQKALQDKEESKSEDEVKEEIKKISERRVRLGIILAETAKNESVIIEDQELMKAVYQQASNYPGQEPQVIEFYKGNPQALEELKGPILEDKVVDLLIDDKITTTEKEVSSEELSEIIKNDDDLAGL